MFFDTDPIRVFKVVISETPKGYVASTEHVLLAKGQTFNSVEEVLEVVEQTAKNYFNESGEMCMTRVFKKGEGNPLKVFVS